MRCPKERTVTTMKKLLLAALLLLFAALMLAALGETSGDFEYRVNRDGTAEITGYSGNAAKLVIPNTLDGHSVTEIGFYAFKRLNSASVTFPDSLRAIGIGAFNGCDNLTAVVLPEGITALGSAAFGFCDNLTSVSLPTSLTTIESNPFPCCQKLTDITVSPESASFVTVDGVLFSIPDVALVCYPNGRTQKTYAVPEGTRSIREDAFFYSVNLVSITVPDSVAVIERGAFSSCENLNSLSLPEGLEVIDEETFAWCDSLVSVSIPDSVTKIGENAFTGCYRLSSVNLPDGVISIDDHAFSWCSALSSVALPDSVTELGNNPFNGCRSLTALTLSPENPCYTLVDGVLFTKDKTRLVCYPNGLAAKEYAVPQGVRVIGNSAFDENDRLVSVTLPGSVTAIEDWAFYECENLASVNIPDGVKEIGYHAFGHCSSLRSLTIPTSVEKIGYDAFYTYRTVLTLTVWPDSYAQKYCEEYDLSFVFPETDKTGWLQRFVDRAMAN